MKKSILSLVIIALAFLTSTDVVAQKFAKLDKSPMDAAFYPSNWRESNKLAKVVYSRPQLKGRKMSKLVPNDKVWRTGANEATEITFFKDVTFGGKAVKTGTYSLFTLRSNADWTIILSNYRNVWGAYTYKQDQDVLRVTGKVSTATDAIEAFSITFEGEDDAATLYLGWENTVVSVEVKG